MTIDLILTIVMWLALAAIALCLAVLAVSQVLYRRGHRWSDRTHYTHQEEE